MQLAPPALSGLVTVQCTIEVITTWPTGSSIFIAIFLRDEQARTSIQQPGGMIAVSDPVAGKNFTLNPALKIAIPGAPPLPGMPAMPGMPALPGMPKAPTFTLPQMPQLALTADLGKKVMGGVNVQGKQFTIPPMPPIPGLPKPPAMPAVPGMPAAPAIPAMAELWTSPDMKLPMHSTITNPSMGMTTVIVMKNVVFGVKIDPAIFQIPAGFKIAVVTPKPPLFAVNVGAGVPKLG